MRDRERERERESKRERRRWRGEEGAVSVDLRRRENALSSLYIKGETKNNCYNSNQ